MEKQDKATGKQRKKPHKGSENLKPFPKGVSGNPSGRPKGSLSMVSLIRKELQASDGKRAKAIVVAMLDAAENGDSAQIRELLNRIDGKVPDKVVGDDDGPVEIVVRHITKEPNNDHADD